jgi:signal peptidase I
MTSASPTVEGNTEQAPTPRRQRGVWRFVRDIIFILLAALVISFIIKTFFIRSFYIPSASMANTLQVNDRVVVSLLTPGLVPLQRGDVVVFTDPGHWLPDEPVTPQSSSSIIGVLSFLGLAAPDDNNHLIKRVIGLPGDHVACCSSKGKVTVNGVPLAEPYIHLLPGYTASDKFSFSVTVPKGDIWVMGDNRDESADSADHEDQRDATPFVPISDVTGRAFVVSWPSSRWAPLGNYPATFQGVTKANKK